MSAGDGSEYPGTRAPRDLLRGLGLFREGVLWRAAVALFGRDDRISFDMPQCLLRVARFRGTDKTEFLDNRQFHGNAFSLIRAAERFLRETLPIAGHIEEGRFERVDEPLVPPLANALCHRDYAIGGGSVGNHGTRRLRTVAPRASTIGPMGRVQWVLLGAIGAGRELRQWRTDGISDITGR